MEFKKCSVIFGLILSLVGGNGCAALLIGAGGAAGAGTVAYIAGELKATENVSLDRAWGATLGSMDQMGFTVTSREKDALSGHLIARGAGDKKITIKLNKVSERVTEIKIRVGLFGDESESRQILDDIKKRI